MTTTRQSAAAAREGAAYEQWRSFALMLVTVVFVITGLIAQATLISRLVSANRQVNAVTSSIQLLEARADNVRMELQMESRKEIITARAQSALGMRMPTEALPLEMDIDRSGMYASAN